MGNAKEALEAARVELKQAQYAADRQRLQRARENYARCKVAYDKECEVEAQAQAIEALEEGDDEDDLSSEAASESSQPSPPASRKTSQRRKGGGKKVVRQRG